MKTLVERLRMTAAEFSPPVQSLLDVDVYKFLMGQVLFRKHSDVEVTFKLIVRDPTIPLSRFVPETELRKCLDYIQGLRFGKTDLSYLRGLELFNDYLFKDDYIGFLKGFRMCPYHLHAQGDSYELTFTGPWPVVTMWETMALATISELYYRAVMRNLPKHELEMIYDRARVRIYEKLETLQRVPDIRFADFGQRRRHSFLWQEWAIGICKAMMGEQFTGTSNTWMAFKHDLTPIGTNAHELPMVYAALAETDEGKIDAQYQVLRDWQEVYGQGLRVFLPDTFTTEAFFRHAPAWVAGWKGFRQDSGDPIAVSNRYIEWLRERGVDPREKLIIPSDGLDVGPMTKIAYELKGRATYSFGWGTLLTNDFRGCHGSQYLRPFSMVCKVTQANGRPCVKLSDNPSKATGPAEEVARYRSIFGVGHQIAQDVVV